MDGNNEMFFASFLANAYGSLKLDNIKNEEKISRLEERLEKEY
jgi:hypothetical protein